MYDAVRVFRALSDGTRLKIIRALNEKEMYAELLAERLSLAPATVSFHMKKLSEAGLVASRREQYYTIYSIRKEILTMSIEKILTSDQADPDEKAREDAYRAKVIKSFMPNGYCETLPAQFKKRQIIYEEILSLFEPGRDYREREVNDIIMQIHGDFCAVRRYFVDHGDMTRTRDGIYRKVR